MGHQKLSWNIWKARNDRMKIVQTAAVRRNIPFSEEKKKEIESAAMSPEISLLSDPYLFICLQFSF